MYKKYNISHCTQKEIDILNKFKNDNSDKVVSVYYVPNSCMGYSLIATYDHPIEDEDGHVKFDNFIDITDYEERLLMY